LIQEDAMKNRYIKLVTISLFVLTLSIVLPGAKAEKTSLNVNDYIAAKEKEKKNAQQQKHPEAKSENGNLVVQLCDGESTLEIEGVREGEVLPPEMAREIASKMMAKVQAQQSSKFTDRDRMTWEREEKRIIEEGDKLFHDWKALGGTIGISCDMCHPNASNTHPETYPKFQTQIKKVVVLRDMINWCIENPMKGKPLALDDARLLAVEAYITSTRKGVALDPGKH
jgi:thiosulfate dehydrogenase